MSRPEPGWYCGNVILSGELRNVRPWHPVRQTAGGAAAARGPTSGRRAAAGVRAAVVIRIVFRIVIRRVDELELWRIFARRRADGPAAADRRSSCRRPVATRVPCGACATRGAASVLGSAARQPPPRPPPRASPRRSPRRRPQNLRRRRPPRLRPAPRSRLLRSVSTSASKPRRRRRTRPGRKRSLRRKPGGCPRSCRQWVHPRPATRRIPFPSGPTRRRRGILRQAVLAVRGPLPSALSGSYGG